MKYVVHYGVRMTTNFIVEAESEEEARCIGKSIGENTDISELEFAADDIDTWPAKEYEISAYKEKGDDTNV